MDVDDNKDNNEDDNIDNVDNNKDNNEVYNEDDKVDPVVPDITTTIVDTLAAANIEAPPLPLTEVVPIEQPLMGSSRTSGGEFRGRATGNVPKHADLATTNQFGRSIKGEVFLYNILAT